MIAKLFLGSDHAGYKLKEEIKTFLDKKKIPYEDLGTNSPQKCDYPLYAKKVANKVIKDKTKKSKGILICGTGTGMCMAANKIKGVRAANIYDSYTAQMSRKHNNANIACLRARKFSPAKTLKLIQLWLKTPFSQKSRHKKRIKMLNQL